ncbi:MAG: hypothetical protein AAGC83_01885 [Pseudomonadota bacterium]
MGENMIKGCTSNAIRALAVAIMVLCGASVGQVLGQQDPLAGVTGTWVLSEAGTGDVSIESVTVSSSGNGLSIERDGGSVDFQPASNGDFLLAKGSSTNPLGGDPAHWVRVDAAGLRIHRIEATSSGGVDIVTEELSPIADQPGILEYRRMTFNDGMPTGQATALFRRQE